MGINRSEAVAAGISFGTGAINFGNDSIVYTRHLRKLPNDDTFAQLKDAIAQGDLEKAKPLAQSFKQLCANLALSRVYMRLEPIVEALDEDALPAVEELEDVQYEYDKVINYLKSAF
jgi:hypothetical protein